MGPPFCDVATPLHEPTPVAAAATSGEMAELGAWTPGPGSEDTLLPLLCTILSRQVPDVQHGDS